MSVADLLELLAGNSLILLIVFLSLPLLAWLYGLPISRFKAGRSPHCYIYAVLVYLVCIPGAMALTLSGYFLFFLRANMMNVNILVFFLPIVSMIATLMLIRQKTELARLPGFDRVSSLFIVLTVTFILVALIQKTRIWLLFHGSILGLLLFVALLFFLLKWAGDRLFAGRR